MTLHQRFIDFINTTYYNLQITCRNRLVLDKDNYVYMYKRNTVRRESFNLKTDGP